MGLPWDDSISNYRSHMEKRGVNSPTYAAVTQPIYTGALERWKNYEELLAPHLDILQPVLEAFDYWSLHLVDASTLSCHDLDPEILAMLG